MSVSIIDSILQNPNLDMENPVLLFEKEGHSIYWLGVAEDTAFRINSYLINDGDQSVIVDPGSRSYFDSIKNHIITLGFYDNLEAMICCHQDPDVAASMFDWLQIKPDLKVITSSRTNVLLPHYGATDYEFYDTGIANNHEFIFKSGRKLNFIEAPFLHFPGAISTFDEFSNTLFSGDIWAAIDTDYQFIINDFEAHRLKLDLFHIDYMASNLASRSFAEKLEDFKIDVILPQHGSIIPDKFIEDAIEYLKDLKCGLDIIYPGN